MDCDALERLAVAATIAWIATTRGAGAAGAVLFILWVSALASAISSAARADGRDYSFVAGPHIPSLAAVREIVDAFADDARSAVGAVTDAIREREERVGAAVQARLYAMGFEICVHESVAFSEMAWTLGQLLGKICGKTHVRVLGDDWAYDAIRTAVATQRRELAEAAEAAECEECVTVHGVLDGHRRLLLVGDGRRAVTR